MLVRNYDLIGLGIIIIKDSVSFFTSVKVRNREDANDRNNKELINTFFTINSES